MKRSVHWVPVFVVLAACGDCDTRTSAFFEPAEFGTYEFDPAPDILVPPLLDFGEVEAGALSRRDLDIANVGRLDLEIHSIELSSETFSIAVGSLAEVPVVAPRDVQSTEVTFRSAGAAPVRERLDISSNDPDEALSTVVLLANRTTPCVGSFEPGQPLWEVHDGDGPMCWPSVSDGHGHEAEYQFAEVPPADDPGWTPDPDNHISFDRRSSLCGTDCSCRGGGDFTYFQTFLYVPVGAEVRQYIVDIENVDDGARVTVFNTRHRVGITDPDSYARIPGGSSADLAPYLVAGQNRIVITHIDDCCSVSRIKNVFATVDGAELETCAL